MKTLTISIPLSLAAVALAVNANAQDSNTDNHTITISVPEVAIVDIEPAAAKNITMGFTAPTEAGLPLLGPADNSTLWLNYSSIRSTADDSRTVSVRLDAEIPGIDINVTAAAAAGAGDGTLGTPAAQLTLTAADQVIISGIGSAYTGDGVSNGHNLTYALAFGGSTGGTSNYEDLVAAATVEATVTYTISDN
ncbi:hypothetical protein [Sphingobacterium gobiense]|uniref:Uncharacterized protein n=1 Tax=Sphingobacterium gobiense TaxID=1382456 RepID=A0A2S9JNH1_9SPHI|nr:hypothetical protein [Sphingobacterium gobiense]PRD54662.1 hypothetical protein C5749_14595 [Sphingobacterium gobiense]